MDTATRYYEQGLNIIPENLTWNTEKNQWEKKPLIEWKPLKDRRQTQEEFNRLPWGEANAFAVMLGQKMKNGCYLAVIDYDVKGKVTEDAKRIGKEILKDFPTTQTEQTISNGVHLVYYSRQKPKIDGTFHDVAGVELLGENKLCLMAPSQGYTKLNDNPPTEIETLEQTYYTVLEKHGFKITEEDQKGEAQDTSSIAITKLVDITKLDKIGADEYQGKHPIHDSTTEKNFTVNTTRNTWFCFRHNSGGGSLQYFAMQQGLIKCEQAKKGALRGKKFRETITLAENQGLIKKGSFDFDKEESQSDRLIKLCLNESLELFYDQHQTPFIRLKIPLRYCAIDGVSVNYSPLVKNENIINKEDELEKVSNKPQIAQYRNATINLKLKSKQFKDWLAHLMWENEQKAPGSEALNSAITVLSGKAIAEGKKYHLYNRVAPAADGIWIDMCDDAWRAIRVGLDGWDIVDNPPILFRRYKHQQPLAEPIKPEIGKEIDAVWKFLDYINIPKDDEKTKLSFICACISYLIPIIPHPLLVVYGPQGSAKSWAFRFIKRLIDPSIPELLSVPRDDKELIQQLDHFWLALYDNLTSMPMWVSDVFCRAATGGGFSKRELYSDDDDVVYDFKRCVGLNGINIAAKRGDLLDRSILIGLDKINSRKTEQEIVESFDKEKGLMLGGLLSIASKTLQLYPETKPLGLFRMADFTRYGCAIAKALGRTADDFITAYEEKVESQNDEAINAEPVAFTMLDFCQKTFNKDKVTGNFINSVWEGTPAQLYQEITNRAQQLGIKTDSHSSWPRAPHAFTRKLNEISSSLQMVGYEIEIRPGTPRKVVITAGRQTHLTLDKLTPEIVTPTTTENIGNTQVSQAVEVIRFLRLSDSEPDTQKCGRCQAVQAKFKVSSSVAGVRFACESCFNEYRFNVEPQGVKFVDETMPDSEGAF